MKNNRISRREFLQTTAGAAGATFAANTILLKPQTLLGSPAPTAASDRVRFGIVGVGMEGNNLLTTAIQLAGVECAAACDLYDGRHELARELVGKPVPTTRRYKELLDNKEIDAIIVAVPDHWHKQVVIDAVAAGKDVYCEKPFSHTPADGLAMVETAKKSDRIVMVGAQRTSSVLCAKAKELYDQGAIGELSLVEATFGRNDPTGAWEYPPPPDLSPDNLDWDTWLGTAPKIAFDPLVFARWRCWKEYGTGVAGDLLVHLISGMQRVLSINEIPKTRVCVWRDLSLERWPQYARRACRSFRIRQCSGLHALEFGHEVRRGDSLYGLQRRHRTHGVWAQLFTATGCRPLSELLLQLVSKSSADALSRPVASGARS
jgi:predicted dehydrogenase